MPNQANWKAEARRMLEILSSYRETWKVHFLLIDINFAYGVVTLAWFSSNWLYLFYEVIAT